MSAGVVSEIPSDDLLARAARTPGVAVVAGRDRLPLLDAVRLIAALGIVWVHAAQSEVGKILWPIGVFGVPFYTYVAVLFMARTLTKPGGKSLGQYAWSRAGRIYMPFLFWSAVYLGLTEMKSLAAGHSLVWPSPVIFYAGGHQHLWFLPFLMIVTLVGAALVCGVQRLPGTRRPMIAVLAVLGVLAAAAPEPAWVKTRHDDIEFWEFCFRALPTVFWSLALALATAMNGRLPRSSVKAAMLGLALLLCATATQELIGREFSVGSAKVLRSLAGLGCVAIALLPLTSPTLTKLGGLGRHSYGIYLAHVAFLRLIAGWSEKHGITPTLWTDFVAFAAAFTIAALLSVALSKSKYTRWTLGE